MHLELKTLFYCRRKSGCHGFCSPPWLILPAAVRLTHSFLPHILPLLPAFGNTPKYRCCLYSPLRVSHRLQDELQAQHFIQAPLSRPLPQPLPQLRRSNHQLRTPKLGQSSWPEPRDRNGGHGCLGNYSHCRPLKHSCSESSRLPENPRRASKKDD